MFSYTSGTTGDPKGVKLTHGALCGTSASVQLWMGADILGESDTYISYLPAAHSFEAALFAMSIIYGVRCGYFGGDVLKLVPEDLPALKPTFFPSVPRLYNKIFGKLKAGTEALTGIKGWLAKKAIAAKMANLHATGAVTHGCYDKIIFKKMKMMMGGNVRLMLTGSAPISGEVLNFLKICFCCPLTEGYGMTETSAGSVLVRIGDPKGGYVGGPVANVKIRIKDIPEMNYLCTNNPPKGEVCFKGPSVMKGYFKNQEKTDEMLSADGWLYSGDVGMIHPNGAIQIVDRAKNIFKLSQGEYIAPEKLENEFLKSEYIA
jgi:long-chain acyl-CoA synthetase